MNEFNVTLHAVERFQTRVAMLPPQEVQQEILSKLSPEECDLLGYDRWNGRVGPVFCGEYKSKKYLIVVQTDVENHGRRVIIPTIVPLNAAKTMHWERNGDKGKTKWLTELNGMP